jgi:hypothetical protein
VAVGRAFPPSCSNRHHGRIQCDRRGERLESHLALERTEFPQSIDSVAETTPVGIIARLEHALDRMETELEDQRRRVVDAKARLAGYEPRLGEAFPLQGELDAKRAQLAEIEADLANTEAVGTENRPAQPEAIAV